MERFCPTCGSIIGANAINCNKCGAELKGKEDFAYGDNKETRPIAPNASIEEMTATQKNQASPSYPQQMGNQASPPYPQQMGNQALQWYQQQLNQEEAELYA